MPAPSASANDPSGVFASVPIGAGKPMTWDASIRDRKARLSNIMGIHKALRIIFREPQRGYAWIKAPNEASGNRTALDIILGEELTNLMLLRRYLDAERGGC